MYYNNMSLKELMFEALPGPQVSFEHKITKRSAIVHRSE